MFNVKEEKKIIIKESDNSDDEDKEQEKFLLVSWLLSRFILTQSTVNSGRVGESEEQKIYEERGYSRGQSTEKIQTRASTGLHARRSDRFNMNLNCI